MSDPQHTALVRAWIDAINKQDLTALSELLADDFVWQLGEASTTGRDLSINAWKQFFEAFPDFKFTEEMLIVKGAMVVTQIRMSGTHRGPFRFRGVGSWDKPIPATHRSFDLLTCAMHHIENDRIKHLWAFWDTATLLRQLGLLPQSL